MSYEPILRAGIDPFDDDRIAHLLRLKRYERPPPDYFAHLRHALANALERIDELTKRVDELEKRG